MPLYYDDDQAMLADSIEKFVANEYDFDTRQKYSTSDRGYSEDVWKQIAELGWTAVSFDEDDGGFGGNFGAPSVAGYPINPPETLGSRLERLGFARAGDSSHFCDAFVEAYRFL